MQEDALGCEPYLWLIGGLAFAIIGWFMVNSVYSDLTAYEARGGFTVMNSIVVLLYNIGGKWLAVGGTAVLFWGGAATFFYRGISHLRERYRNRK